MNRLSQMSRSVLRRRFPPSAIYEGSGGTVWFAGFEPRAPSIAAFFCGDDIRPGPSGITSTRRIPARIDEVAAAGGLPILRIAGRDAGLAEVLPHAIAVPGLVDIHAELPDDVETLRGRLRTSTTKEDFRRIRRADFTYRVTTDPDAIREFHARHYAPLVAHRFPEDGQTRSVDKMLAELDRGGELVCADIGGEWVAGIFNMRQPASYALMGLGIRNADQAVRQKRVVAALIVRSLERAVELGMDRATLGRSLPFLGKGPVWFKAKWGGILTRHHSAQSLHMFLDLRHAAVRRMLSASPVIHSEGEALVVSAWLEPGEKPLQATVRDAGRFPGINRWYVLAEPETLAAGEAMLSTAARIVPVAVSPGGPQPLWLGDRLPVSPPSP